MEDRSTAPASSRRGGRRGHRSGRSSQQRRQERQPRHGGHAQVRAVANTPAQLEDAPVRGQCERMCPANEEASRTRTRELSRFERELGTAVKQYRRAAAGRADVDPRELRPPQVLLETLRHLFTAVLPWPHAGLKRLGPATAATARPTDFLELYHFLDDRVRSVRQDFVVQRVESAELVTALEQTVRFYLLAGLRAPQVLVAPGTAATMQQLQDFQAQWSDKLHEEQLTSALARLRELYTLSQKVYAADAGEFLAYGLLLQAQDPQALSCTLRHLPTRLRHHAAVQRALQAAVALQRDDLHGLRLATAEMPLLERAALLRHLPRACEQALRMLNRSLGKQDRVPLEQLARWLPLGHGHEERAAAELVERLCLALGVHTERHDVLPPPPTPIQDAADSWEASAAMATLTICPPTSTSLGFVRFKLAPMRDELPREAARELRRDLALLLQAGLAPTQQLQEASELVLHGTQEAN